MLSLSGRLVPVVANQLARQQLAIQTLQLSTTSILRDDEDPMRQAADYPKTKEERERAAKKYNLIPEDYEPYPEEEGWGDYPNLKCVGAYNKDWYGDYYDIQEHRFYGEPIELNADLYFWERVDPQSDTRPAQTLTGWPGHFFFFGLCTGPFAIYYFFTRTATGKKLHFSHQRKMREFNPPGTKFYWFPTREEPHHH